MDFVKVPREDTVRKILQTTNRRNARGGRLFLVLFEDRHTGEVSLSAVASIT
jgi:hypothetical protein